MADIVIQLGVQAPANNVNVVTRVLELVYQQPADFDNDPFVFNAHAEDFTDGAIGVLASMSFILHYEGKDGIEREHRSYVMQSFARNIQNGKAAFTVTIPPDSRKLIRVIFEQRNREENEEERSAYVQKMADSMNLE